MKNVPELRFKEFSGEWKEEKFGQLFSFISTNSFSREKLNYNTGKVKNIHYGDIHTKFRSLFDIKKEYVPFINKGVLDKKINDDNFCKEGDLIIADASEDYEAIGKTIELINLNCEKIVAGLHTIMARPINNNIAIGFTGYLMQSSNVHYQIKMIAQGIKVLSISSKRLKEIFFNIPDIPEQQKIASFLSAIDKKIELTDKKLEYLESYKKGLMQKLLTGEIRFPDFNDEWEEKKLGNLLQEKNKRNKDESIKLVLSVSNKFGLVGQTNYFNKTIASENTSNYKIIEKSDFAYNPARINVGSIAFMDNFNIGIISPMYIIFKTESNLLNNYYLNFWMQTFLFKNQLKNLLTGSVRQSLNFIDMKLINILIPSIHEQQKIASFLSAVDKKIELLKSRLKNLKIYKKGLLQKMFV